VLRPSASQAHLTQARKVRFLPIVNSDANGVCTVWARTQYPITPDRFPTLDLKRSKALSGFSRMNAPIS